MYNKTFMSNVALLMCIVQFTGAYKPVVLLHGIMTGNESMSIIRNRIEELHPGTIIYNTNKFSGWSSLESMWYQVKELGGDLLNVTRQHPNGINLLGILNGIKFDVIVYKRLIL